jgi:hypothetical protein
MPETFWAMVKTNLQAGRVRLIFVADVIPPELRRIVEFLNAQMDPAEVLALEIKQYVGEGLQTLVPRVIGQSAEAARKKPARTAGDVCWDAASFFAEVLKQNGEPVANVARKIFDWANPRGHIWYGSGKQDGSFGLTVPRMVASDTCLQHGLTVHLRSTLDSSRTLRPSTRISGSSSWEPEDQARHAD